MKNKPSAPEGYVRVYRSILNWSWFTDSATLHVFLYLLLNARFRPGEHAGVRLETGQLITGRRDIMLHTGLTEQKVRTALNHLRATHEITIRSTHSFSLITVTNYARYQALGSPGWPPTESPAAHQPLTNHPPNKKNGNPVYPERRKGADPLDEKRSTERGQESGGDADRGGAAGADRGEARRGYTFL